MLAYRVMLATGALIPVGLLAVIMLHTGWEAVAAALTVLFGFAFVAAAIAIGVGGDRLRPRGT